MDIKSTKILDNLSFESIFQLDGKVQSIDVISAYTDTDFINKILDYILENGNKVDKPHFSIYLDYHSSGYSSNHDVRSELNEASKKLANYFDTESGVYLVNEGQLFHSKCIVSQSRTSINLILGSINSTNYGFFKNEEMAICGQATKGGNSIINRLANQVWAYMSKISPRKVGSGKFNIKPSSLRQVLLGGEMYYEQKDNNPFNFPLNLPNEIRDINQEINSLLGAKINNSISVELIITKTQKLNKLLKRKSNSNSSWKKYCIETCYGFWAPTDDREKIKNIIKGKLKVRSPYYKSLFDVIHNHKIDIRNQFSLVAKDIEIYVSQKNLEDESGKKILWRCEDILTAWDDWYERLEEKLNLEKFCERIIVGVISASVPNVWSDKINAIDFEESFAESLHYYCIKGQVSSNKHAARSFFNKYPLDVKKFSRNYKSSELVEMISSAIIAAA